MLPFVGPRDFRLPDRLLLAVASSVIICVVVTLCLFFCCVDILCPLVQFVLLQLLLYVGGCVFVAIKSSCSADISTNPQFRCFILVREVVREVVRELIVLYCQRMPWFGRARIQPGHGPWSRLTPVEFSTSWLFGCFRLSSRGFFSVGSAMSCPNIESEE